MRRHCLLGILWILTLLPCLAQPTQPYSPPGTNFQVDAPTMWELKPANFANAVWLYDGAVLTPVAENVQIKVTKLSAQMGFDMVSFMARSSVESQYPQLALKSSTPLKIAKTEQAHRFEWAGDFNGKPFHLLQVLIRAGDFAYELDFGANDANWKKHLPTVERMVKSFKVK